MGQSPYRIREKGEKMAFQKLDRLGQLFRKSIFYKGFSVFFGENWKMDISKTGQIWVIFRGFVSRVITNLVLKQQIDFLGSVSF